MNQCVRKVWGGRNILPKEITISIVDDDGSVRKATKTLVRALGYTAHTFASAEEFLNSDQIDDTHCLIADVHMPGLSGVELQCRLIRENRCIPVIFVTGCPDESIRSCVLEAGAVGYLGKPYSCAILIDCIETALRKSGLGDP